MTESCIILMATYNGQKYIREQIESILNQTYTNWNLLIRDDGSSDDTYKILMDYAKDNDNIEILKNTSKLHGPFLNFWNLINIAKDRDGYDYYFFSDQDDVWSNNKIEKMIELDKRLGSKSKPRLIYSDMSVIDKNGSVIINSMDKSVGFDKLGLSVFFNHSAVWGCCTMINYSLLCVTPVIQVDEQFAEIIGHDAYYAKSACLHGGLFYCPEVLVKHREHDDNVTGDYKQKTNIKMVFEKICRQWGKLVITHARIYTTSLIALEKCEKMESVDKSIINKMKAIIRSGGFSAVEWMAINRIKRKQCVRTIGMYYIVLTKKYKKYLFDMTYIHR